MSSPSRLEIKGESPFKQSGVYEAQIAIIDLWRQGKIRPHIHAEVPLNEFAVAFEMMENREVIGKVVMSLE